MFSGFIGEIRIFAGKIAPRGWLFCDGQLLNISVYQQLFSVIGKQYGGDGINTFRLPNLSGTAPMGHGEGKNFTLRKLGDKVGEEKVTLLESHIPSHTHIPMAVDSQGEDGNPEGKYWAQAKKARSGQPALYSETVNESMNSRAINATGGGQPHNIMQPYLVLNFIICFDGEYPVRD